MHLRPTRSSFIGARRPVARWAAAGALVTLGLGVGVATGGTASAATAIASTATATAPSVPAAATAGLLSPFAGTGTAGAPTPGPATRSRLDGPFGTAVDGLGDVYIADSFNNEVEKVSPSGALSIIAGTGKAGPPKPGPAREATLHGPEGMAVDGLGNVYIADEGNDVVDKVSPAGILSVVVGTGTAGVAKPGPATRSQLNLPYGLAVDQLGNLYVADADNNEIEKVSRAGILSIVAGTGTAGASTPGRATRSDLSFPTGVAVDQLGDVYVADTFNEEIDRISTSGILAVIAGDGAGGKPTPGPATHSDLEHPYGVAVDSSSDVYVGDTFNHQVERISPLGILTVIAGTGTGGKPTPGPAIHSDMGEPADVAVSGSGNVYIADYTSDEVVRVRSAVAPAVAGIAAGARGGFVTTTTAGNVDADGTAFRGSPHANGVDLTSPVATIATTPTSGYLLATTAGSVYNYGTRFHGSPRARPVTSPIAGIAATADGGYLLATTNGAVYNYGTRFHGSPRASHIALASPITGITATPGGGYVLATGAGAVYNYGTRFHGSPRASHIALASPITAITATPGGGYVLATGAGAVYNFATPFLGSPHHSGVRLAVPVAGITATDGGYLLASTAGTLYGYTRSA